MWRKRWTYWVAAKASRPGIWRLRDGGYLVACRVTNRKGRRLFRMRVMHDAKSVHEAETALVQLRAETRAEAEGRTRRVELFSEFAISLYERKIAALRLKSAASRERWDNTLTNWLVPAFGEFFCQELRLSDLEEWRIGTLAARIAEPAYHVASDGTRVRNRKHITPGTANSIMAVLRTVCAAMAAQLELRVDPSRGLEDFDASTHPSYTDEEPNTLRPEDAARFLAEFRRRHPQHYAMVLLGFVTGLRPSSMRPLRRKGPEADVLWAENTILIRRSNARGQQIMNTTKTKKHQRLALAPEVMAELELHVKEHVEPFSPQSESELLFPSHKGGLMARTVLQRPFVSVRSALGIPHRVTPRAMRRTFQDLCRRTGVADVVKRAISGHATETMAEHYSTVEAAEMTAATSKIVGLLGGSGSPQKAV